MSDIKRYSFWPQIVHLPGGGGVRAEVHFKVEEDGLFVVYQDYAKLKAENERLRKACELVFSESAKRKFLMCYKGDDFYVSLQAMEAMSEALGYRKTKDSKQP